MKVTYLQTNQNFKGKSTWDENSKCSFSKLLILYFIVIKVDTFLFIIFCTST